MKIEEAKKKVEYYQNGTGWVTSEFIIDILDQLDQPKPEVPKFAIDWVDDSRERYYEFDEWFYCDNQPKEVYKWLNCKNKRQADLNALALVTLIVNGPDAVTVEKEKLYTVEIPTNSEAKLALVRREDKKIVITIVGGRWRGLDTFQLTEQEIRKDFDWAWQWKKEVRE
ncbi:DUF1642 domain-containing protein [Streptococcus uberis]|uniref:DUF1642 domain-containing protein n=1 Tax=Streptococcus uberis TaxID=1349 RepID=A0A6L6G8M6_STRUB|nr:DUF1642 domain-containing protein [Streptococcus uberis]MTC84640.1 DUF1642 domain-containing protein [Streptococcus uberis]MTC85925.1 DUF1642 domain-containing protein [Streptococcus uberis]MTD01825.1 DUF1642 domain-containing protein [Streptococcus uberis]